MSRTYVTINCSCGHSTWHWCDAVATTRAVEAAREREARAWDEGVAVALAYAKRAADGIGLHLESQEGKPWPNPYRTEGDQP